MSAQPLSFLQRPRMRRLLTIAVIVLGLGIAGFFGTRAVRSFRQIQYIRQQGLDRGVASADAIRPWMTIRFVAVAYAVPEEYMYSALNIPFDRRNADQSLGELNRIYERGLVPGGTELVVVDQARAVIIAYRQNPVAIGLRDVRPWMSLRYIANSAGVPLSELLAAAGLPAATNADMPLDLLSDELRTPGGPRALADEISAALDQRPASP